MQPRISVNKLGEFLTTASPVRRRAIIRDQKVPPDAVVPRYRKAIDPIAAYLNSGGLDVSPVLSAIETLRTAPASSDWVRDDNENTALALECFLEVADQLPMDSITYVRGDESPAKMLVAGVGISVRPDFLLQFQRRGRNCIGALKIHFIKSDDRALRVAGQEYVATLCHQWLQGNGSGLQPDHMHCLSLDLFRRSVVRAPAAFTRRMRDVEVACQDIALLWPTL